MSAAVARPSFTMKLPWVVDTPGIADARPLQPRPIDECAGRAGISAGTSDRSGFWKMQPALGVSSGCVLLRYASDSRAIGAKRRRIAGRTQNTRRQQHFAGSLQAASIVAEFHRRGRKIARLAVELPRDAPIRPARRSAGRPNARCRKRRPRRCPASPPTLPAQRVPRPIVHRTSPLIVTAASARTRSGRSPRRWRRRAGGARDRGRRDRR